MIFGNIHTYKDCGLTNLKQYLDLLATLPSDAPDGKTSLENGAYYTVFTANLRDGSTANFESHKKYIDLQYILEGTEEMEYADLTDLVSTAPYSEEMDCEFWSGKGTVLSFRTGDFAVYAPADAHKPALGEGVTRKVVVKIPVIEQ